MMAPTDNEMMVRLQAGDAAAFDTLQAKHWHRLVGQLQMVTRCRSTAEDLAQEAFLRVFRARGRYEPTAKFTTWLYRIAVNRTRNWIRDTRRHRAASSSGDALGLDLVAILPDPREATDLQLSSREERLFLTDAVRGAIRQLPARQQRAIVLRWFHEMSYERIGVEMACEIGTVKSLLFRAHSSLRVHLQTRQ